MSWTGLLSAWLGRRDARPMVEIERDIDDELRFHLESLAEESRGKGMSPQAAWSNAFERFGSLEDYSKACRWVDVGDRIMLLRLSTVGLVLLAMFAGYLLLEVQHLRDAQLAERMGYEAQLAVWRKLDAKGYFERDDHTPVGDEALLSDITGDVVDGQSQPLDNVDLLVILKTWPNRRYRQQAFTVTTDEQGRFHLPNLVPLDETYAVQAAAFCDGYAFESMYHLKQGDGDSQVGEIRFQLEQAKPVTLLIQDKQGRPVANARVAPSRRVSLEGEEHLVYFQASEPVRVLSNERGQVGAPWFATGDRTELYLQLPGQDWERRVVDIPQDRDLIVVSAATSVEG